MMEKPLYNQVDLEKLRKTRDILDTDLKILNDNLKSLTGRATNHLAEEAKVRNLRNDLALDSFEFIDRPSKRLKQDAIDRLSTSPSSTRSEKDELDTLKNKKLTSVLVLPDWQTAIESTEADAEKRKVILESQRKNKQVFDRNKRMFGMLVGTLKQFKTEETCRERSTSKRSKIEERLELAVEIEREATNKEVDRILEQKQEKEKLLDSTELQLDAIERFKNWDNTNRHLCSYIQTQTKPRIFWLPKEHNPITERKLRETRDYFSLCVAERTAKFKKELEDLTILGSQSTSNELVPNESNPELEQYNHAESDLTSPRSDADD